ncbi:MAG: FAD-dependent monooxygenase, partial [Rhizobium oryzihabitans]
MLDVVVAGGGYVGLSVAVAIKQAARHLNVQVVEAAPEDVWKKDVRASAIIAAATRMLDVFGIWNEIEPEAQPINKMIVTDSKTADPVRPVFLTFDGVVEEGRPFAHMVPNVAMVGALRGLCERLGVEIRHGLSVSGFTTGPQSTSISLSDGSSLEARLLVACDGVRSA